MCMGTKSNRTVEIEDLAQHEMQGTSNSRLHTAYRKTAAVLNETTSITLLVLTLLV